MLANVLLSNTLVIVMRLYFPTNVQIGLPLLYNIKLLNDSEKLLVTCSHVETVSKCDLAYEL